MNRTPVLLKGGLLLTQNKKREIFKGDLLIERGEITKVAKNIRPKPGAKVLSVDDQFVLPGFIQTHIHLCQALFRGCADDLKLLDWLKKKIWPFEAAHTEASLRASAQIGLMEVQLLGTTTILDMGTVNHTHALFEEAEHSGIRYFGGKCLMDHQKSSGPLYEPTEKALAETKSLIKNWDRKSSLINYALCPRFAISCTDELLRACSQIQKDYDLVMHTHASESKEEVALVKKRTGLDNIHYLDQVGLLNSKSVIAHGIHMNSGEIEKIKSSKATITHCPSSNLKLASGIAPIEEYNRRKLNISIGADGGPLQ